MIRKTIIALLTLAAAGSVVVGGASFCGISVQRLRDGWHSEILVLNGNVILQAQRLQGRELNLARQAMSSGIEWYCGSDVRRMWAMIEGRSPRFVPWMHQTPSVLLASVPLHLVFILFAAYPALAFIRGPLRRYRRRKRGLCIKCGYNLTGLTEPRCPECGREIKPS